MDPRPVRYKPVTKTKIVDVVRGSGPLPDENFLWALTNSHWVFEMAAGLEEIIWAEAIEEAHGIARRILGELIDPVDGLREGIADSVRLRWRLACREPKREEEE